MTVEGTGISRFFRLSGMLLILGLFTEAVSLHWIHPIAFMAFVLIGGAFLAAGVLLYLYSLVSSSAAQD
jgi:hypothetical protein